MNAQSKVEPHGLDLLRAPFPPNQISKLPKETRAQIDARKNRESGCMVFNCKVCGGHHHKDAVHLDYVGHAALTDRLLDTDIQWSWEPVAFGPDGLPAFDRNGGLWIRLTVGGVTRLGYGSADGKSGGDAVKEIIGDALRNAAMRFGAALDLWHKGDLHAEDESDTNGATGDTTGDRQISSGGPDHTSDEPDGKYAFPDGPATGITQLKAMARELYRGIASCTTKAELDNLTLPEQNAENAAIMKQLAALENPAHRQIWEGDGKDNPGIAGLINRKEYEFARQVADYATV